MMDRLIQGLGAQRRGERWYARCPAHDYRNRRSGGQTAIVSVARGLGGRSSRPADFHRRGRKVHGPNAVSTLFDAALKYSARGWSIIPIRHRTESGKEPGCKWKAYQKKRPSEKTLRRWFSRGNLDGLAVICGTVSDDLVCRDFDDESAYRKWSGEHPKLAASLPTVRTGRGFHVYFRSHELGIKKQGDGELRGAGYCLLPPSRHPSGTVYEWVVELRDEPPP